MCIRDSAIAMALFGLILGKFVLWINDIDRNVTATASVDDAGVKNLNHQQWKIQQQKNNKKPRVTHKNNQSQTNEKYIQIKEKKNHQNQHATINDYFKREEETKTKMIQI